MEDLKCIVYRVGTRDNFRWKRIGPFAHGDLARAVSYIEQQYTVHERITGYAKILIEDYEKSMSIGLPEGYEPKSKP